jgi:hypothetical protein
MISRTYDPFMRVAFSLLVAISALGLFSCSATVKPPRLEDSARIIAPLPACVMHLPARKKSAFARRLSPEQYWPLVFPDFDATKKQLPENSLACTGRSIFDNPLFQGGEPAKGWPLTVVEGDILVGSGGDRLRVLWMRTHEFPDGTSAGPLALVRATEDFAELYAVGVYKASTKRPRFGLERMGAEAVVTVQDDSCTGNTKIEPCKNAMNIFLPRKGELVNLMTIALEQRDYATAGEPGIPGRIEYRLTTAPTFFPTGVKLFEQVKARDDVGHELRTAELERTFQFKDPRLVTAETPLWQRIFPNATR